MPITAISPPASRDRTRAYRHRQHEQLAIDTVDSILELPDQALRQALAALRPSTLLQVAETLSRAANRKGHSISVTR